VSDPIARDLIERLLSLAELAVNQALNMDYDDPEDYHIYRELQELKPRAEALLSQPEAQ
jgi:hypothetical protein